MKKNNTSLLNQDTQRTNVEDMIFEFLDLSQKILTLIKHENVILEQCGCLSLEAYLAHRNSLLQSYEENARFLIEHSIGNDAHDATRDLLAAELSAVQSALTDNTTYQFKSLENKISLTKGDASWH